MNTHEMDTAALSDALLDDHLDRCRRLLDNQGLIQRLPDRGASVVERHKKLQEEKERRTIERANGSLAEWHNENNEKDISAIVEKYRTYRVSVEDKVRQMYEGSLSEREIKKILEDIPRNYLLTYDETQKLEKALLREKRQRELQRLHEQSTAQ